MAARLVKGEGKDDAPQCSQEHARPCRDPCVEVTLLVADHRKGGVAVIALYGMTRIGWNRNGVRWPVLLSAGSPSGCATGTRCPPPVLYSTFQSKSLQLFPDGHTMDVLAASDIMRVTMKRTISDGGYRRDTAEPARSVHCATQSSPHPSYR